MQRLTKHSLTSLAATGDAALAIGALVRVNPSLA